MLCIRGKTAASAINWDYEWLVRDDHPAILFKDTLKAFNDLKNKHKTVWSNMFWYVKVCIFWKCDTLYIEIIQKFSTKNAFFFVCVPQLITVLLLINDFFVLKHKVRLSKSVCEIFHFQFRFSFIQVYIFVQQGSI